MTDVRQMLLDLTDEAVWPVGSTVRMLAKAGQAALREGGSMTADEWASTYEGEPIRLLLVAGGELAVMICPGFGETDGVPLGVTDDGRALVTEQDGLVRVYCWWPDEMPLCHPDNPWCEYSEEAVSERHAEWGPYKVVCLEHHDLDPTSEGAEVYTDRKVSAQEDAAEDAAWRAGCGPSASWERGDRR